MMQCLQYQRHQNLPIRNAAINHQRHQNLPIRNAAYHHCPSLKVTAGWDATFAQSVQGRCLYTIYRFHYEISWNHPHDTGTPVSKYQVRIWYRRHKRLLPSLCYEVPASQKIFIFNETMGLCYACPFSYAVIPYPPVSLESTNFTRAISVSGCPVAPYLKPLPKVELQPGSNFSFVASFEEEPVPAVSIRWYFSTDTTSCSYLDRINQNNIVVSYNTRILHVLGAREENIGCYVAAAQNGIGEEVRQRGYLNLKEIVLREPIQRISPTLILEIVACVLIILSLIMLYGLKIRVSDEIEQRI